MALDYRQAGHKNADQIVNNVDNNEYEPNRKRARNAHVHFNTVFNKFSILNLKTERLSPQSHYKVHKHDIWI